MPKKPSQPFGHIIFGKDGSVRQIIERLPDVKKEQEREVGERFAAGLKRLFKKTVEIKLLKENDHDFLIKIERQDIVVQATEIVTRDYMHPLTVDDFVHGRHPYSETVQLGSEAIFGINIVEKEEVLLKRILAKIKRNYAKPKGPFWLLVWTTCSDFMPFWIQSGQPQTSSSVSFARKYLADHGSGPFNEIWFLDVQIAPSRIWPEDL